jgi:hypothetical protein
MPSIVQDPAAPVGQDPMPSIVQERGRGDEAFLAG